MKFHAVPCVFHAVGRVDGCIGDVLCHTGDNSQCADC